MNKQQNHDKQQCGMAWSEDDRGKVFDAFMQHLPAAVYVKDKEGRYLHLNAEAGKLFGQPCDRIIGKTDDDLWDPTTAEYIKRNDINVFENGTPLNTIEKMPVKDVLHHFQVTKFLVDTREGEEKLAAFAVDITDKLVTEDENSRLHSQLLQAQKMEAIGTLAGGIAHDFNNLLAAIIGYVEIVRYDIMADEPAADPLDQVLKAAHRAKELVSKILTFSRKSDMNKKPVKLTAVVKEALQLLHASLPRSITIRETASTQFDTILADATQIHQVMLNLCTNAAHAMDNDTGVIEVALDQVETDFDCDLPLPFMSSGKYVRLSITDSGRGMSPVVKKRIFDPYFTTKSVGKGTGMGLSMVHGIVQDHGGCINVESEPGKGSCFQVYFPAIESKIRTHIERKGRIPTGDENVLFVDDEKYLVELGREMLQRLGYSTECRASAIDALEAFKARRHSYDLLITDLTMPNMGGDTLAREVRRIRPDIPIILCSGYSDVIRSIDPSGGGIDAFLKKPFGMHELSTTIRNVLDLAEKQRGS